MGKRKAPSEDNPNHDLCEFLIELSNHERNVAKNIFKANAYKKAASVLAALKERVKSGDDARQLKGIGQKIAKKIDEFLQTGKLRKLEEIHKDENSVAITLLTKVSGIGPAKAQELVDAGIKTLEHLKKNQDKLNHHQKIGLKYFEDFEKMIPRSEIKEIENIVKEELKDLDECSVVEICGSYRRGKDESGDIDILVSNSKYTSKDEAELKKSEFLKKVVKHLEERKLITDTISQGDTKFMGVCRLNKEKPFRRLDIRFIPHDQYYCAVLYFTGSDVFNKNMRAHASEHKYLLNEYSLKKLTPDGTPGEAEKITCEEDIFKILELPYKTPEQRDV